MPKNMAKILKNLKNVWFSCMKKKELTHQISKQVTNVYFIESVVFPKIHRLKDLEQLTAV